MNAYPMLDGTTRIVAIIGDPIAQVRSPGAMTQALTAAGCNCVVVPIHVTAADVDAFIRGASLAGNLDGIIATIPHKPAAYRHCATAIERAHRLGAANILRRNPDGGWHGDMCDGAGLVDAIRAAGCEPAGKRALVIGAGGAGSAIALALIEAGVARLALHDQDGDRRDEVLARLAAVRPGIVESGSADPSGHDLVVNATPAGMRVGDPSPVRAARLTPGMFVADAITGPATTPLIAAAQQIGCATQTGDGMFACVRDRMLAFLLEGGALVDPRGR